jgi:adenylate cyclase
VTRRRYRLLTAVGCAVAALAIAFAAPPPHALDGPLLDVLVRARAAAAPVDFDESHPVAVVAVDERSLEREDLAQHPRALFAPVWAQLIETVTAAGARSVGFDLLFVYTANRLAPDWDRPFLGALAAHRDRVVLARSARALPAPPFLAALDPDDHGLGLAEIVADPDGVHRRVRRSYQPESGEHVPGLAAALLARAGHAAMPADVLLAPRRHPEAIPTYALADVLACGTQAPEIVRAALGGRVVLVGSTLPDEDRKISSARFLPQAGAGPLLHPCGLRRLGPSTPATRSVPGVHVHALAIDAVLRGQVPRTAPAAGVALLAAVAAGAGALAALAWSPWRTAATIVGAAATLAAGATFALHRELWVPIALPLAGLVAAPAVAYVVRYLVEERTRRRIELAFGRYLSPHVVAGLAAKASALRLGGERREVSVMFADLSGFTALSAQVPPETLTQLTNEYLGYIVDAVEATGGYVDKFIGDAVMAIWGAPVADPAHASHAVLAAVDTARRVDAAHAAARARGAAGFAVKIGVNSGFAVVGNVGTERRYNYTAVGETVNVASRLESVPGLYGCAVVVSERTAELARETLVFRELDRIRVKGREAPLAIFEPLAEVSAADPGVRARAAAYEAALAAYREMRFEEATAAWTALSGASSAAAADRPAAAMADRARAMAKDPPPTPWDGVWTLSSK